MNPYLRQHAIKKIKYTVTYTKKFTKYTIDKNYHDVKDHCHNIGTYRGAPHSIFNLKYDISNEITVVFYNELNNHFIIRELVKQLQGEFNCLREKTESFKIFSFPIAKEVKSIHKNRKRTYKNHIQQFDVY